MQELVSILIPVHGNRFSTGLLPETLESVRSQSYGNLEIIVINDGAEGDLEDLPSCPKLRLIGDGRQKIGQARARNMGLDMAQGELIMPFDSDDLMTPFMVEKLVAACREADGAYSHFYRRHRNGHLETRIMPTEGHSIAAMMEKETVPHHTMMRRWVYDSGVRYDETHLSCIDLDMKIQWVRSGALLKCVPEPLFLHRLHREGQETGSRRQVDYCEEIRRKWRLALSVGTQEVASAIPSEAN